MSCHSSTPEIEHQQFPPFILFPGLFPRDSGVHGQQWTMLSLSYIHLPGRPVVDLAIIASINVNIPTQEHTNLCKHPHMQSYIRLPSSYFPCIVFSHRWPSYNPHYIQLQYLESSPRSEYDFQELLLSLLGTILFLIVGVSRYYSFMLCQINWDRDPWH